jgi:hypothetical protein
MPLICLDGMRGRVEGHGCKRCCKQAPASKHGIGQHLTASGEAHGESVRQQAARCGGEHRCGRCHLLLRSDIIPR